MDQTEDDVFDIRHKEEEEAWPTNDEAIDIRDNAGLLEYNEAADRDQEPQKNADT